MLARRMADAVQIVAEHAPEYHALRVPGPGS
jgi:hypothetical protein